MTKEMPIGYMVRSKRPWILGRSQFLVAPFARDASGPGRCERSDRVLLRCYLFFGPFVALRDYPQDDEGRLLPDDEVRGSI